MKKFIQIVCIVIPIFGFGTIQAQDAVMAGGGDLSGSGGTVSYSVAQTVYTNFSGSNGKLIHGIQQPFEIYSTSGIENAFIDLTLSVYPNPATDFLILKVDDEGLPEISFQLIDIQGNIIDNKELNSTHTNINMDHLPASVYFLNVRKNKKSVKTFKIIKN